MQLEWAHRLNVPCLIIAPLGVTGQTVKEAAKLGITAQYARSQAEVSQQIVVTNYEMVDRFDAAKFGAVVLDESSILKHEDAKTRQKLIDMFQNTPYRLCCTATPAPNDIAELGNHAEFLGVCSRTEMLATWFVHDDMGWRLKGHAVNEFYKWLSSWGMMLKTPSDIGFSDDGYTLPPLNINPVWVNGDATAVAQAAGQLFLTTLQGVTGRAAARRQTISQRCDAAAEMLNASDEQWLVFCGLNDEGRELRRLVPDAILTEGQDSIEAKQSAISGFVSGQHRVWITKSSMAGFGLNLQHCHNLLFLGVNDSYEQFYQAIRRCWRFGQQQPVNAHIVISDLEKPIYDNLMGKGEQDVIMSRNIVDAMKGFEQAELGIAESSRPEYQEAERRRDAYTLLLGDCVARMKEIPDASMDFSIFSPPFASLYTYSDSDRDMGNSRDDEEFFTHFGFMLTELERVMKTGRIIACHVFQVPAMLARDGYIGIKDFRGQVIQAFEAHGLTYHGDITIDKNPQAQAIRTHSKSLLFAQLRKDASWMRPGLADYLLIFRKPGEPDAPVHPDISNEEWIQWAHPVWYDIHESDTLNAAVARENADERHICPLQLSVIERGIRLWTNKGEMVFSPFAGIGSEGYMAIKHGRRFTGCELKPTYYNTALQNLERAVMESTQWTLFDMAAGE